MEESTLGVLIRSKDSGWYRFFITESEYIILALNTSNKLVPIGTYNSRVYGPQKRIL